MGDGAAILAIGDVHLGTACSGLPDALPSWGLDPRELTPTAALRRSVDLAIEQKVDAVMFAGDIVESTNARFEAILPLEDAIKRLLAEGIQVVAVAGNHDFEALPRFTPHWPWRWMKKLRSVMAQAKRQVQNFLC